MRLDTDFLNKLKYRELNLKEIELEMITCEEGEDQGSEVGIEGTMLTEQALKQLSDITMIPYKFTQVLRSNGKGHVLSYIQKQVSQISSLDVIAIVLNDRIISIVDADMLCFRGKDVISLDKRLRGALKDHPVLTLKEVVFDEGNICYSIYYKELREINGEDWGWGFTLRLSATGAIESSVGMEVMREQTLGKIYLPHKTYNHNLCLGAKFEDNWTEINDNFLELPPTAGWTDLTNMLAKTQAAASYREVNESRNKLLKLKVDKFDAETSDRITDALEWKRILKAYLVKDMDQRPTRNWFTKASTPLTLLDVINLVSTEATHAPNTVDATLRQNLLKYGGTLLAGNPDLYNQPPQINWDEN